MTANFNACNNRQASPVYCGESGPTLEYSAITDTLEPRLDNKRPSSGTDSRRPDMKITKKEVEARVALQS
jgi:hypothetical protein